MTDEPGLSVDPQQLEKIVQMTLKDAGARLGAWQAKPLHGSLDPRNRLVRVSGQASTPTGERAWSVVLKTISTAGTAEEDPAGYRYRMREPCFYESGMLDDGCGRLVAPICYGGGQSDAEYWMWLEDVREDVSRPWPPAHYAEVARCMGCFNGTYLAGKPLPAQPWLSRHFLRKIVETAAPTVQDLPELRKLWYFQRAFPTVTNDLILEAWERRDEFIGALERLPQTFCHLDAFSGNLFWRRDPTGQGQLVTLDWSFAGIAAVGEELAPLAVMDAAGMGPADAARFYDSCISGYQAGLADAGCSVDPQLVRFSSLTAGIYRYLLGANLGELWSLMRDERNHAAVTAMFGAPSLEVLVDRLGMASLNMPVYYEEISRLLKEYS